MDPFRGVQAFVAVADEKSYRRAAERLGVTPAAVSKAILVLERETGVALLARTSRRVDLTEEGRGFYQRCHEAIGLVEAGRNALSASRRKPMGRLAVSSSFVVVRWVLRAAVEWAQRYPDVTVALRASDRLVRFAGEDVDIGVRVGGPGDETVVAHELRATRWICVASPRYLARRGTPTSPEQLASHDCFAFVTPRGVVQPWSFAPRRGEDKPSIIRVPNRIEVDQGELLIEGAESGTGIAQVLDFMADDAIRAGRLVEVLGAVRAAGPAVHAVYAPEKRSLPRVRLFVEHLRQWFRAQPA